LGTVITKTKSEGQETLGTFGKKAAKQPRKRTIDDTSEEDVSTPKSGKKTNRRTPSPKKQRVETIQGRVAKGLVTIPTEYNENSAGTDEENQWEDESTITNVARVPVSTFATSIPNVARRPGSTPAAGSSRTDPDMSIPTIPTVGVSNLVKIFKQRYSQVKSKVEKENLFWEVFKFSHLQNPSTVVSELISHIRRCFEEPEPDENEAGYANEDATEFVEVRISEAYQLSNFPKSYLKCTVDLKVEYELDMKSGLKSPAAFEKMYYTLKSEGFKFVHQASGEAGPWSETDIDAAIGLLKRRVHNLKRNEHDTTQVRRRRKRKIDTDSIEPIDVRAVSSVDHVPPAVEHDPPALPPVDHDLPAVDPDVPAPKWIFGIRDPHYKSRLANYEFRSRMKDYSPYYESLPSDDKTNALQHFMECLHSDGYQFVDYIDGAHVLLDEAGQFAKISKAFSSHAFRQKTSCQKNRLHSNFQENAFKEKESFRCVIV
jgi:hypothetical protein